MSDKSQLVKDVTRNKSFNMEIRSDIYLVRSRVYVKAVRVQHLLMVRSS